MVNPSTQVAIVELWINTDRKDRKSYPIKSFYETSPDTHSHVYLYGSCVFPLEFQKSIC
jgi:hypothetical protein